MPSRLRLAGLSDVASDGARSGSVPGNRRRGIVDTELASEPPFASDIAERRLANLQSELGVHSRAVVLLSPYELQPRHDETSKWHAASVGPPKPRVENVTQGIAEEVVTEYRQTQGDPRSHH